MKKWIGLLSLLTTLFSKAQDTMSLPVVQQQLALHQQQDTTRVNLLNQMAWRNNIATHVRDSLLQKATLLSEKLNYPKGLSNALSIRTGYTDISEQVNTAKRAIQIARLSKDPETLYWAYRALCQAMISTSQGVQALDTMQENLRIANAIGNPLLIMQAQSNFVDYYKSVQANYPLALQWALRALQTAEHSGSPYQLGMAYRGMGAIYLLIGNQQRALENMQKALVASRQSGNVGIEEATLNDMGERYRLMGKYPEALQAYQQAGTLIADSFNIELNQSNRAAVYEKMGNHPQAFRYGFLSLQGAKNLKDTIGFAWIHSIVASAYLHTQRPDSAIWYATTGYQYALQTNILEYIRDNSGVLSEAYEQKNRSGEALRFYKIFIAIRDSMLNNEVTNKSNTAQFDYDLSKKQAEIEVLNKDKQLQQEKTKKQQLLLAGAVAVLLLISTILVLLFFNSRQRKKAYQLLTSQKQELQVQRDEKELTLQELRATQAQLIQSEKMASLGELTAGIAHEIQNPLNFINNFSDLNTELIDEMRAEIEKGDMEEVQAIAEDISTNNEKIAHHGKRADSIVKGMMQHSRASGGIKESTDINALAEEYLHLSYHGLRARDKSFNAKMETHFDKSIGTINLLPQDVGRVLLNLYNNAFYAVNEKKKKLVNAFEPVVSVRTQKLDGKVQIAITDNGMGISEKVLGKIFQPFFTTKPTGEGTGLGLSLSYDIITKSHGGTLNVESREGEGTTFTISLPA